MRGVVLRRRPWNGSRDPIRFDSVTRRCRDAEQVILALLSQAWTSSVQHRTMMIRRVSRVVGGGAVARDMNRPGKHVTSSRVPSHVTLEIGSHAARRWPYRSRRRVGASSRDDRVMASVDVRGARLVQETPCSGEPVPKS